MFKIYKIITNEKTIGYYSKFVKAKEKGKELEKEGYEDHTISDSEKYYKITEIKVN